MDAIVNLLSIHIPSLQDMIWSTERLNEEINRVDNLDACPQLKEFVKILDAQRWISHKIANSQEYKYAKHAFSVLEPGLWERIFNEEEIHPIGLAISSESELRCAGHWASTLKADANYHRNAENVSPSIRVTSFCNTYTKYPFTYDLQESFAWKYGQDEHPDITTRYVIESTGDVFKKGFEPDFFVKSKGGTGPALIGEVDSNVQGEDEMRMMQFGIVLSKLAELGSDVPVICAIYVRGSWSVNWNCLYKGTGPHPLAFTTKFLLNKPREAGSLFRRFWNYRDYLAGREGFEQTEDITNAVKSILKLGTMKTVKSRTSTHDAVPGFRTQGDRDHNMSGGSINSTQQENLDGRKKLGNRWDTSVGETASKLAYRLKVRIPYVFLGAPSSQEYVVPELNVSFDDVSYYNERRNVVVAWSGSGQNRQIVTFYKRLDENEVVVIKYLKSKHPDQVSHLVIPEHLVELPGVVIGVSKPAGRRLQLSNQGQELQVAAGMLRCLLTLHNLDVAHLDIKPGNFAWDEESSSLSLLDFDTAVIASDHNGEINTSFIGTPGFVAPEVGRRPYNPFAVDVFALGKLIRLLLRYGKDLRHEQQEERLILELAKEMEEKRTPVSQIWRKFTCRFSKYQ